MIRMNDIVAFLITFLGGFIASFNVSAMYPPSSNYEASWERWHFLSFWHWLDSL